MFNKITLRSYSYILHFLHSIYGEKWFLHLYPKVPSFVQKPQGILGAYANDNQISVLIPWNFNMDHI